MDFGVVLQTNPPASRVVDLTKRAELLGFTHAWTFDSHLLWEEPFVIYSQMLSETRKIVVGPMVTNPGTRDWSVTASAFATLNEMYGNRTVCGIGRGDSALRTLGAPPTTLAQLRECVHVIRELANGRTVSHRGRELSFPWVTDSALEVWVAAYGPKALALTGEVADGFILQLADPDIASWMIGAVRAAAERAGRDPAAIRFCVAAPAYVGDDLAHMRAQTRWFGGMVGNHIADIVEKYGEDADFPEVLVDYIKGRTGYDYNTKPIPAMDGHARLLPAPNRFPSSVNGAGFKPIADKIHALGLKFGVHLMRGIPRLAVERNLPVLGGNWKARDIANTQSVCPWNPDMYGIDMSKPGAQAYYDSVFEQFAAWGVDYVKYDWCATGEGPAQRNPREAYATMSRAIAASGRPMVFSICEWGNNEPWLWGREHGHLWRTTGDIINCWDCTVSHGNWGSSGILPILDKQEALRRYRLLSSTERRPSITSALLWRAPAMSMAMAAAI